MLFIEMMLYFRRAILNTQVFSPGFKHDRNHKNGIDEGDVILNRNNFEVGGSSMGLPDT